MIPLVLLLLMTASQSVDLGDEFYQIPRDEWRFVPIDLKQQPAVVKASFEVKEGKGQVRLALMRAEDFERLRNGEPHGALDITPPGASGSLVYRVTVPGEYVIVVDNRADGAQPASVRLGVTLVFSSNLSPPVTGISRERQLAVVLISFAVFFGIVTVSARQLWRAIRR
jgi:hypothetical protein